MKNQKIFDIIPPERYQKENLSKKKTVKPFVDPKQIQGRFPLGKLPIKKGFLFILLIVFLGGILLHFFFQKADISIWLVTEVIAFETNLKVSSEAKLSDLSSKTFPGRLLSSEKVIFQEFSSSGKGLEETKAKGIIRVYNAYSTSPQVLIATTRFVSAEGRLFRTPKRVTIPGGKYEKGKLQPGFVDIEVVAAEAGDEYNIGPSTFSIPGFAGTARFTAFYGKSSAPMQGGAKGEVPQITQQDLDTALQVLKGKIEKEAEDIFKNKISEEFVLINEAFQREEDTPIFSHRAGEEGESFTGELRFVFKALVFKQEDLENIIKEFIISEIPKDKALKTDSLQISYNPTAIDLERGTMTLNSDFSATVYPQIATDLLKKEISRRSLKESRIILDTKPDIIRSEVILFPLWLSRIPKDFQKINIELNTQN